MNRLIRFTTVAVALGAAILPGAAAAEDWNPISRSTRHVYFADAASIAQSGSDTTIKVARAAATGSDRAYRLQTYAFDCPGNRFRVMRTAEHDAAGAETDAFDEDGEMEAVPANSMISSIKGVACDGERAATQTWPTLAAYLDSRS